MDDDIRHICPHCRASGVRLLGECAVCHYAVCERCGNVQIASGTRRIVHNECLKGAADAFRMIKFVR